MSWFCKLQFQKHPNPNPNPNPYLGVNGLSAGGPPSKLRPLFGLFCLAIKEAAEAMETVLLSKEPVSGEIREESM